jgi:hypothetical protein
MLKLKYFLAPLAAILMLTAGSVRADFITTWAGSTTKENQIHDSSLETANTATIGVGTIISGVVLMTLIGQTGSLQNIAGLGGFAGEVTAVFALQVSAVTPASGGGFNLTFTSNSAALAALTGLSLPSGATSVLFENDAAKPLTAQLAAGGGTTGAYFTAASAGHVDAVIGLTGSTTSFTGTASNLTFPPVSGLTGSYNGFLNLLPYAYGAGTLGAQTVAFKEPNGAGGFTQFATRGTQSFNPNSTAASPPGTSPFAVTDDSSLFYFLSTTPVPEPSTCVLFSMGSAMLLFLRKRRNKVVA